MKVIIIEDEPLVAKDLSKLLQKADKSIEIIALLESVKEASEYFGTGKNADLIFADIQLSDGVSFEVFENVKIKTPVIFTTAYDEFAIRAFKINSIDYLLKPLDEQEVKSAVEKYKFLYENSREDLSLEVHKLISDLNAREKKYKRRFTGHLGKSLVAVSEENIAYFSKDVLIFLVTLDNKQIITDYKSLEELEDLVDPGNFFRANRQCIIHINSVERVQTHYSGKLFIELRNPLKEEVTVSREKAGDFKRWFEGNG